MLLHGDGQYAPEHLPAMIAPLLDNTADVVLGSRMINRGDALRGKMPFYKWIGNQILTFCQNRILGSSLAEFHTGYRAFRVSALASIPFERNSNYFDFDTDILIQLMDTGKRFREIPVPTFYGDELSRVNGLRYAALIVRTSIMSRIMKLGIFYDPRFDYEIANTHYTPKLGYTSSHEYALASRASERHGARYRLRTRVHGEGTGREGRENDFARSLHRRVDARRVHSRRSKPTSKSSISRIPAGVETVLLLDVIEHLVSPELFLRRLRNRYCSDAPEVVITTGNITFLPIRLAMLLGQFNYGKRGILDLTHTRLFTFGSLRRLLAQSGYEVLDGLRHSPRRFRWRWGTAGSPARSSGSTRC